MLEIVDDPMIRDDLDFALADDSTTRGLTTTRPHLCCGTAGNGLMLHSIGTRLGRQAEVDMNRAMVNKMVLIQQHTSIDRGCMGHGLFQGTAGLAWAALQTEGKVPDSIDIMLLGT